MDSADSGSDTESVVSSVVSGVSKASSTSSSTYLTGHTLVAWWQYSFRTIVLTLLPLLSFIGAYGTWTLAGNNGTFDLLKAVLAQDEPKFPGTEELLLMKYTGIHFLDQQLVILVTFFAPVVDAGFPALNLFSVWGFGQLGAVWTLMVMESMRFGNKGRAVSFIGLVGLIMQNISYTITTPLWIFVHLITSPVSKPFPGAHANSVLLIPSLDLQILPISITFSYIIPSLLMALPPDTVSSETHQIFIALWQPFPLFTVAIHQILRTTINYLSTRLFPKDPHSRPPTPLGASYLGNAKHIYRFVLMLCILTHLPVMFLTLFATSFFPSSFSPSNALQTFASQSLSTVFLPFVHLSSTQIPSLASGVHNFLQWDIYIGSTAFILWAILLYRNATTEKTIVDPNTSLPIYRELLAGETRRRGEELEWRSLAWKVLVWGFIGGPIGAVGLLLWERDEIVRQKIKQGL